MAESPQRGVVVWFVGRPGAGKSFAARRVYEQLRRLRVPAVLLDGDVVRASVVPKSGYGEEARRDHYATLANLAAGIAQEGVIVLVPATAARREYRDHARAVSSASSAYMEIHVDISLEAAMRQDEGREAKARVYGQGTGAVPGVDVPFEAPESPDVRLDLSNRRNAVPLVLARLWAAAGTASLRGEGFRCSSPQSYVGVALDGAALAAEQREICTRFRLEARAELHLTLAFLGEVALAPLAELQREIVDARLPWDAIRLERSGVGGVLGDADREVAWWSVKPDPALLEVRTGVIAAIRRILPGVPGSEFFPHVTLGSRAPEPLFDVHGIAKPPNREESAPQALALAPAAAHVTNVETQPASLLPLHGWT